MTSSEPTPPRKHPTEAFIDALDALDNAGRARLKRNAGRLLGEARQVHQIFYQALPLEIHLDEHEDYFLIATLFPLLRYEHGAGSLETALRRVRPERNNTPQLLSLDRRFQTLLDSDRAQLPFRLRQAVRLAAANRHPTTGERWPLDWALLLRDVLAWERDGRPIQLRWARTYFVGPRTPSHTPS